MKHLKTFEMIESVVRAGSIRKASEDMHITASALNRRIKNFETEFGSDIFERLSNGMRLNPAGELLMQHIRAQRTDLTRVQSQIADLSGVRRGHVSIACSQALLPYFLPRQIAAYRRQHPGVTFSVRVRDRVQAEQDLANFNSDLALVFEPVHMVEFDVIHAEPQPIQAVIHADHPLAQRTRLRFRECLDHPLVLPSAQYGVRTLLEACARKINRPLQPVLDTESFEMVRHYVLHEQAVGFQIPIGLDPDDQPGITTRPVVESELVSGQLLLGQMKGRTLPVGSLKFAHQLAETLARIGDDTQG